MRNISKRFLGTPTLESERLILRKFETNDFGDVYRYAGDPDVTKYLTWMPHPSIDGSREYIKTVRKRYRRDDAGEWAIIFKATGRVIGAVGFVGHDAKNSCGTLGYVLSKDHWGMGIMTEAIVRLIRFAFEEMALNRIEAYHMIENEASGRVMKKAGMYYEGLLKQKLFAKGRFVDVKQYALTRQDWKSER